MVLRRKERRGGCGRAWWVRGDGRGTLLALLTGPVPVRDPIPAQMNPHRELKHTITHTTIKIVCVSVWKEMGGTECRMRERKNKRGEGGKRERG